MFKTGPSHSHRLGAAPLPLQQGCKQGHTCGERLTGPGISCLLAGAPRRPWFQRHSGTTWAARPHGEWFCSLQRDLVSSPSLPWQTDHRFPRGGSWISFLVQGKEGIIGPHGILGPTGSPVSICLSSACIFQQGTVVEIQDACGHLNYISSPAVMKETK